MKKTVWIVGVGLAGLILAVLTEALIISLCTMHHGVCTIESCGGNCGNWPLWFVIPIFAFLLYGGVAFFAMKKAVARFKIFSVLLGLTIVLLFIAHAWATYFLFERTKYLYTIREIQPSIDFSPIVLAKKDIRVFEMASSNQNLIYTMRQWERCAIGSLDDTKQFIQIECKNGYGWIRKIDEINLIVLPASR